MISEISERQEMEDVLVLRKLIPDAMARVALSLH